MNIQPRKGTRKVTWKPITSEPPEQIHLTCTTVLGRWSVSTVIDNFNKKTFVNAVFSLLEGNAVLDANFFWTLGNGLASEINH